MHFRGRLRFYFVLRSSRSQQREVKSKCLENKPSEFLFMGDKFVSINTIVKALDITSASFERTVLRMQAKVFSVRDWNCQTIPMCVHES